MVDSRRTRFVQAAARAGASSLLCKKNRLLSFAFRKKSDIRAHIHAH